MFIVHHSWFGCGSGVSSQWLQQIRFANDLPFAVAGTPFDISDRSCGAAAHRS
jgi:hypothetical protein